MDNLLNLYVFNNAEPKLPKHFSLIVLGTWIGLLTAIAICYITL